MSKRGKQIRKVRNAISRLDQSYDKDFMELYDRIKDPMALASALSEIEPDYLAQRNALARHEQRLLQREE